MPRRAETSEPEQEAYQPKLYEKNLSQAEASRRIETLKQEIALADSF
jgi:hypothetical protein